jgi:DNA polymerase-3 subunit gamma/tau
MPGTVSIRKAIPQKEKENPVADEPDPANAPAHPFTEEDLFRLWGEFADKLRIDKPHLFALMSSRPPLLEEETRLIVTIDNKILEEEFREVRGELAAFLRQGLSNFRIDIQPKVVENHTDLKPYTDKEKFERMAARNPELHTLREQLDLDIEY